MRAMQYGVRHIAWLTRTMREHKLLHTSNNDTNDNNDNNHNNHNNRNNHNRMCYKHIVQGEVPQFSLSSLLLLTCSSSSCWYILHMIKIGY